jgi:hypothetical protein
MERTEAVRILNALRAELVETERRGAALRKLVDGYVELFPDLADPIHANAVAESETRPKGREAVRLVLMESPGQWFTLPYMLDELQRRGWLPESNEPGNAVRAALTRLVTDPDFQKQREHKSGAVVFAYKPLSAPEEVGSLPGPAAEDDHSHSQEAGAFPR